MAEDERTFCIRSTIDDEKLSCIELRGDGLPTRIPPIGHFIEHLTQMLWIDAYEGGPWTPSFIESVAITQPHGQTLVYTRCPEHN